MEFDYREVDIERTPGAAEEVIRRTGKRAIPQFVINGEWVQPYRPGEGFLFDEMTGGWGFRTARSRSKLYFTFHLDAPVPD